MNKKIKQSESYIMAKMPYKKAIWKLSIPSIFTFLVVSAYLTVDRIIIAQFISPKGLGAIQYFEPVFILIIAFISIASIGTKIRYSILLGQNKPHEAKSLYFNSIGLMAVIAFLCTIFLAIFGKQIPYLFGISGDIAKMSAQYYDIFKYCIFGYAFSILYDSLFKTKGYNKIIFFVVLVSQLTNLTLDIVFIKYLQLGIRGAAIATAVAMNLQFVLYFLIILAWKKEFIITKLDFKSFSLKKIKKIIYLGLPAIFQQVIFGLRVILVTFLITKLGSQNDFISYSAIKTIAPILIIPVVGIIAAIGPLISYNFGFKNYQRVKEVVQYSHNVVFKYVVFVVIFMFIFNYQLATIFQVQDFINSRYIFITYILGIIFIVYPSIWTLVLEFAEIPKESIKMNLVKNVIFVAIILFLLNFGSFRILILAFPISDVLFYIYTKLSIKTKINKLNNTRLNIFKFS